MYERMLIDLFVDWLNLETSVCVLEWMMRHKHRHAEARLYRLGLKASAVCDCELSEVLQCHSKLKLSLARLNLSIEVYEHLLIYKASKVDIGNYVGYRNVNRKSIKMIIVRLNVKVYYNMTHRQPLLHSAVDQSRVRGRASYPFDENSN